MTQLKAFLTISLVFIYLSAFGQLEKGNYNLGGDVELNGSLLKSDYFNSTNFNLNLSPSISKFLTDKWLLGIHPSISSNFQKGNVSDIFNINVPKYPLKGNFKSIGLGISTRYYFNTNNKLKFFVFANGSYDKESSNSSIGGFTGNNRANNFLNYEAGFGANMFFNSEIALESTISYAHRETHLFEDPFTIAHLLSSQNFLLNFKINHFIGLSLKDKNDTPQYIKKGRRTLNGMAWFGNIEVKDQRTNTKYGLAPKFSQFITNNVMLMGDLTWQGDINYSREMISKVTVAARYYKSIKKRFFIYPEVNATYSSGINYYSNLNYPYLGNSDYSSADYYKANIGLGLGGSYFLSDNVALDATFLQAHLYFLDNPIKSDYFTSQLGVGHIGLLYFIR